MKLNYAELRDAITYSMNNKQIVNDQSQKDYALKI